MASTHDSSMRLFAAAALVGLAGFAVLHTAPVPPPPPAPPAAPYTTWSDFAGGADGMQYSALKQINKTNVNQLELAWFYQVPGPTNRFGFNPVIVDGVMFVMGRNAILALDAVTGKEIWSHAVEGRPSTDRGINYWENKDRSDRRLLLTANGFLEAIDARTGALIPSFGTDGRVDFKEAVPRANPSGTPGHIFEDLILMGSTTGEGYGSSLGYLRAYNVVTGKLAWTIHTIPRPGDDGYETWPEAAFQYVGGANTWGEMSIDEKRGIAYFPTGSATYDFYGADRIGANLFAGCLMAIDARTGKRLWYFQVVHHDIWDYDSSPAAPKLMTVRHEGKMIDVVAMATKYGFLFVFDRVTGTPIWPIIERPVPKSDVPGEQTWPTQPFPTWPPPYARQSVTVNDLNPYVDAEEQAKLRDILVNARNEGLFTPTSTRSTIRMPGELGGNNWGGMAGDPETGTLYVRTINAPTLPILSLRPRVATPEGATPAQIGRSVYAQHCESCHGADRKGVTSPNELGADRFKSTVRTGGGQMPGFPEATITAPQLDALIAYVLNPAAGAPARGRGGPPIPDPPAGQVRYYTPYNTWNASNGLPAIAPPWSEIVAYNLGEGTIRWRIPFGTVPSLAAKGIKDTGSYHPTRNGLVVTAGGLLIGGTFSDRTLHIYDKDTGKILWEKEIDSGPEGIPSVYEVGGRQYIVFAARTGPIFDNIGRESIAWSPGKPEAQGYYVFALPGFAQENPGARGGAQQPPAPAGGAPAGQGRGGRQGGPGAPPVPSISKRPAGSELSTIRVAAQDNNFWFGWRVGTPATSIKGMTFSDLLAKVDPMGVPTVDATSTQTVSYEIPKALDYRLQTGERNAVNYRLRELNQQVSVYRVESLPTDEATRRKIFEFAKGLIGAPVVVFPSNAVSAATELDALAAEYDMRVAIDSKTDPGALTTALSGRSTRVGIAADLGGWMQSGVAPVDGLKTAGNKLFVVKVSDRSTIGAKGTSVPLGNGAGALSAFFVAAYRSGLKPLTITIESAGATEADLLKNLNAFERVMLPAMAERVRTMVASPAGQIRGGDTLSDDMRAQIEAAAPRKPLVTPKQPRKLLVTDLQMGFVHTTIPHMNYLIKVMAKSTGAFTPSFSNDLELLKYPKIKEFDAIFLNSTCGMIYNDPEIRASLLRFVQEGGGIGGNHCVTFANNNWPEFAELMGGWAGAHHVEKQFIKVDDPNSPLTKSFGSASFEHTDEFYIFPAYSPYSREKQHVLLSIDVEKSDRATNNRMCTLCTRPDQDYGVAWIRMYGKGHAYFNALGHTDVNYTDQRYTNHLLAAIQYILGDLDADATPSGIARPARK